MKPATLVETGVGSAGECGLTEGTVETGATSEDAGHVARIGVQLKVLQEERVFLASGILGCSGNRFSARLCERDGGERRTREREAIAFCENAVIPSMPNPRSSSPSLASGVSYQTHGPTKQNSEKKRVSLRPPRDCAEGSDDRPPTPKNGGLATGSAGLAVQALVPGVQACVSRRSAIEARGDQRRHACPCVAFDCHADGFPATIPAKCSFQLCSFRGSSRHHLGG